MGSIVASFPLGPTNDFLFPPLKTRFIRVVINDNYGGDGIHIQGIGFYGVDMRLVSLLREFGLERSLPTLLANVSDHCGSIRVDLQHHFF
jgi:hypothetical protein